MEMLVFAVELLWLLGMTIGESFGGRSDHQYQLDTCVNRDTAAVMAHSHPTTGMSQPQGRH